VSARATLIETWNPVTGDLGLIRAPVAEVAAAFATWQGGLGHAHAAHQAESLAEALDRLPPLSTELRRVLFLPTRSDWTIFLRSGINGSDPFAPMSCLAGTMGVLALRVCARGPEATWPASILEAYAPPSLGGTPPLGYRRRVVAMNDGGRWIFEAAGEPFPFEDLAAYRRPRKRERFTTDMLVRYLEALGARPFADEFYAASAARPAIVLDRRTRWPKPPPEYSLAEVIAGAPWRRG
jgi:hypothetical protein